MKSWILVLTMVAVLGFSGLAEAKGAKHGKALRGSITAINGTSFTFTTKPSKKDPNAQSQTYTVDASSATITGGTLSVGEKVNVAGTISGANIVATTVKIAGKHNHKKKA